ncbi:hypothetical protein ACQKD0_10270 [Vreelandella aquamarina]|uniref:hypothetical protein n=1 Tax=Halomonadaceae TaxID=28256 RepID=UPI0005CB98A3|nr:MULTISPECIES: hypothetical protein [Halomonas]KJD18158.1 hypothetical protein VE30_14655 [Halomonas meridiana]MCF2913996.1 hypothetical protein [Halomonas sp. Cn5-12]MCO7244517.1 hypothetical protein [Halomonas sp. Ps84H-12]|tara:strand:+ start:606 stop:1352 length:747 start_codon:yes stop_codon:yes gene_type:complete
MKYQDEISVSDVLCLIARRWRWAVTFFLLPVAVIAIVLIGETEKFEYQSVYQLAEKSTGEALEKPSSVIEKLKRIYYPQAQAELAGEGLVKINEVTAEITSPRDTLLITILSEASEQQSEKVQVLHEYMMNALQESQSELFERFESRVQGLLENARENFSRIKDEESNHAAELATQYLDLIAEYEDRLLALQEGRLIMLNSISSQSRGLNSIFLLLVSVVIGMVLAVVAPLAIEGLSRVWRMIGSNKS